MDQETPERLRMKDWDESDRPREKLALRGAKSLSNAELIAILIGSGNQKESAVALSQRILSGFGNKLEMLSQASISQLTRKYQGIGEAKAISILAGLELGKRLTFKPNEEVPLIKSSQDIYDAIKPHIVGAKTEEVWAIFTNSAARVIKKKQFSTGGINQCVVDIKLIIKEAMLLSASGIVLVHNHPSGNPQPSLKDRDITQKLAEACKYCDLSLIDHIIATDDCFFSFFEEGLLTG